MAGRKRIAQQCQRFPLGVRLERCRRSRTLPWVLHSFRYAMWLTLRALAENVTLLPRLPPSLAQLLKGAFDAVWDQGMTFEEASVQVAVPHAQVG
jgi:hypothetical protein